MSSSVWVPVFADDGPPKYGFRTQLWRSQRSGLHVLAAVTPTSVYNLYATVRTEAHDDRGLPHCLEHLVFLGSQRYPHKGLLDVLSQSILSAGTNAWTAQDHTTFTLAASSRDGLLGVLDLFLDHIFFPTLRDAHYLSEVFAITGTGEEVGVVLSEMQGLEHKLTTMACNALAKLLYPASSWCTETGALMGALRHEETMNMAAVRAYHDHFYRPDNAVVCVTGPQLDGAALLAVLENMDVRLAARQSKVPLEPFSSVLPRLTEAMTIHHQNFPSKDEDYGRVDVGWRLDGTLEELCREGVLTLTAVSMLLDYLSDGISSPLYRALVDTPAPFCRSLLSSMELYRQPSISVALTSVPVARLDAALEHFVAALRAEVLSFDLERMQTLVARAILDDVSEFESNPAESLQDNLSLAFLYLKLSDLPSVVWGEQKRMRALLTVDREYWIGILKAILDLPAVAVVSHPSSHMHADLAAQDRERIEQRSQHMGPQGLAARQALLDAAMQEIEDSVAPEELVEKLTAQLNVDVSAVSLHEISTWRSDDSTLTVAPPAWLKAHAHCLHDMAVLTQVDHYSRTQFVDLSVFVLDVDERLKRRDKLNLELFCDLIFESGWGELSHVAVGAALERDLLSFASGVGVTGSKSFNVGAYPSVLHVFTRAAVDKYDVAVEWTRRALLETRVDDADRVAVAVNNLLARISEDERSPSRVTAAHMATLLLKRSSVAHCIVNLEEQKAHLTRFREDPVTFMAQFGKSARRIRQLVARDNMLVHVVGDMSRVWLPRRPWAAWPVSGQRGPVAASMRSVRPGSASLRRSAFAKRTPEEQEEFVRVVEMPIEGANVKECWMGPTLRDGLGDVVPLIVLTEMLSAQEGPLWVGIRGRGLAYGAHCYVAPQEGYLVLQINECSSAADMHEALRVAHAVLEDCSLETVTISLATGISIAVGNHLQQLATHVAVAESCFRSLLRGYTDAEMIAQLASVTERDLLRVWQRWVRPSTRPGSSVVVMTVGDENGAAASDDEAGGDSE